MPRVSRPAAPASRRKQYVPAVTRIGSSAAEKIVYGAFDRIEEKLRRPPIDLFKEAIENVTPAIEVRSRRVGGATYQVPVEVRPDRKLALAMRWIISAARAQRNDHGRQIVERIDGRRPEPRRRR